MGGNSLNLIRIPSLNEVSNIMVSSDLNGNITPWDVNVWHWIYNYYFWCQNNRTTYAILSELSTSEAYQTYHPKNEMDIRRGLCDFVPIIEYIE